MEDCQRCEALKSAGKVLRCRKCLFDPFFEDAPRAPRDDIANPAPDRVASRLARFRDADETSHTFA
jgi:hypothetical protein